MEACVELSYFSLAAVSPVAENLRWSHLPYEEYAAEEGMGSAVAHVAMLLLLLVHMEGK